MSVSTSSTACWSSDARSTSAPLDPGRGRGQCAREPDPCNTVVCVCADHHAGSGLGSEPLHKSLRGYFGVRQRDYHVSAGAHAHMESDSALCPHARSCRLTARSTCLQAGAHERGRRSLRTLLPVRPHESIASRKRWQSLGAWTWLP